ncbi:MAG: PAS domain S-box protein [Deltaproteobacteria bacterium]|nr:PAS domain S-box protein [Deltaproteobacteria bacterium]
MPGKPSYEELKQRVKALEKNESEQRHSEEILKEIGALFHGLFKHISDGVILIEKDGHIALANPAAERILGLKRSNIEKRNYISPDWCVTRADGTPMPPEEMAGPRAMKEMQPVDYVVMGIGRPDGSLAWLNVSAAPVINEAEELLGVIGIFKDITEQKRAAEALRESEQKYRTLIENAYDAIFVVQDEGITFPNPRTEELTGYSKEELEKIPFAELIHPENRDKVLEIHRQRLAGEDPPSHCFFRIINKRGEESWVQLNTALINWENRPAILYFMRDVTQQKRLETQLQHAVKMEAIGTLVGGIAHDFNNYLQAIFGYIQILLMEKEPDDPDLERLRKIEQATKNAIDLIQQLLTFSRKVESRRRPIDLNQEIRLAVKLLRRSIPRMIDIEVNLADDLKTINADPVQMEQIFMNLAVNARDAMPKGGKLVIETENVSIGEEYRNTHLGVLPGQYALLSVSDTGTGMDKEVLEHIFEPFYTTKEPGKGTGLGLSMVHGLVKDHGGYIMCYSEPGKGTCFKIYLPVLEVEAAEQGVEREKDEEIPGGDETILLVDDEEMFRDIGQQILRRFGYNVLLAHDGESALELYRKQKKAISLIILDLVMPGMGGSKCLEALLGMDPAVNVLIASGYSINGTERRAIQAGGRRFIRKPFDMKQMLKQVRKALDRSIDE